MTENDTAAIPASNDAPVSDHRDKSITHVIGLSPVIHRSPSGTDVVGYATGVRNSQIWIRNGTTYCTSRYATFSAESHIPTLRAAKIAATMITGSSTTVIGGMNPKIAMITNRNTELITKSGIHASTALAGITRRGKYTFDTRFWLPTRLLPEFDTPFENSVHGTSPTNANTG